ncbi:MAG: MFS transporter [Candidatus Bathyarchaeota archaeon]
MTTRLRGMTGFTVIWAGQFVSLLGTSMTNFALTIWAWEQTGQATALALMQLFFFAPQILMSPLAGALVDRWSRKRVMILSDIGAGLGTAAIFLLMSTDRLQLTYLYAVSAFMGAFQSFQFPAYSAAVTTMLEKEQYARASGMIALAQSASGIFGPAAAGALIGVIGKTGIIAFDILSILVAISALLAVPIPQPAATMAAKKPSLLQDSLYGFRYIAARPSLLGLQLIFFIINFTGSLCFPLIAPMVLSKTGNDTVALGAVQSAFGAGGVVGGLLLSAWGGPKKRVNGVLLGMFGSYLLGFTLMGVGSGTLIWATAAFIILFFNPLINGSSQAIWQSKVPPEVQGRVFSARALIAQISAPIAMLITGPLTDGVLTPAMMPGGSLAPAFGWLVDTGPGAGPALLFLVMGVLGSILSLTGYIFPHIRNVEDIIPDHDAAAGLTN